MTLAWQVFRAASVVSWLYLAVVALKGGVLPRVVVAWACFASGVSMLRGKE